MKLYYATGTCSMSCVMEIKELGIPCELIEVSWKRNENVDELARLNPLETTPVLVNDEGQVLTQNAAILEYLGDRYSKGAHLAPAGTWERAQTTSWLSFVAADFHKAFAPAFRASTWTDSETAQAQIEKNAVENISAYVEHIERGLAGKNYISGSQFSVADCYLFTILGWCEWLEISLDKYKSVTAYMARMSQRPGVKQALELEKD